MDPILTPILINLGVGLGQNLLGLNKPSGPSAAELAQIQAARDAAAAAAAQQKMIFGLGIAAMGVVAAVLILRR